MVMEAPSLFPELLEAPALPGKGSHAYYRRTSDGRIITAPAWPSYRADMEFKGYTFLPQFGTWLMSGPGAKTNQVDRMGRPFNPAEEPWRLILQSPDGAAAFPTWQIIAYRWHIRPPYREVQFPQLEGIEVFDFFCPECETGIFSSVNEREAMEMLRTHLTSRTNDAHSYRPEDLRALGQELNIDFFAPRRRAARTAPALEERVQVYDLTPNTQISASKECPECHESFPVAHFEYARHMKTHKASAAPA